MPEKISVYNAQKQTMEKYHLRDTPMMKDDYRFVVTVLVFNSAGQLLIQKRKENKFAWPNYWDFTASGAVDFGEEIYQAAERELFEELGITVQLKNVASRMTFAFHEGWDEIYFITKDIPLEALVLQESEVIAARWVDEAEYLTLLESGAFIPYIYGKSIFDFYRNAGEHLEK
ncbi:NUDIX hydrolase [Enterococcus sp. LJL120]